MTPEIFAEWLRRQGHKVIRTSSSYWVESGPRIFQAFPYHWIIRPSQAELQVLFLEQGALGLRYSAPPDAFPGIGSYHVVYASADYPLSNLPKRARHDVQKGLRAAEFRPVAFERMARLGWQLRADTLIRQGRLNAETIQWWQNLCLSAEGLTGFEAWGAFVDGVLAAALIAFTGEDCCSILYQQSRTKYLSLGINNALAYAFTTDVLNRPGRPWIFYGLHSLDAPPSVDEFKFRMRYTAKPVRQRVEFHPLFRPFVNKASHAILRLGHKVLPGNGTLSKAEGLFRFYLQGKIPLSRQPLPPHLAFENPSEHLFS